MPGTERAPVARTIVAGLYDFYDRLCDRGMPITIQRSDFVTRLAAPLLLGRWKREHGVAPRPRQRLTSAEAAILDQHLGADLELLLRDAAGSCADVVASVRTLQVARHLPGTTAPFSERTAVWVRERFASAGRPSPEQCEDFARGLVVSTPSAVLDAEQFESGYSVRYDRAWELTGAENLRSNPPSLVGLGMDSRPCLVRQRPSRRRDWSQGTNRPVYERYRLRFKLSARSAPPRCTDPACDHRPALTVDDPAMQEVTRACAGFGLAEPAHRQIIRSIADGLSRLGGAGKGWTTWAAWASPCRPIDLEGDVDAELSDAVASAVSAWASGPVGAPLVAAYGFDTLSGPLKIVLVRKAWMDLLGYERTFADPMRRCGIPRVIRTALYRHAPGAIREWIDGVIGDPEPTFDDAEGAGEAVVATLAARRVTLDLLTGHTRIVRKMVDGDLSWREDYQVAIAAQPDAGYLAPADAFDAIRDLLEGMGDER